MGNFKLALAIFCLIGSFVLGNYIGRYELIEHCKEYSIYSINKNEKLFCVVKPIKKDGELAYLRPNGKELISIEKTVND